MSYYESDDGLDTPEEIFAHYKEYDAEICVLRDAFKALKDENEKLIKLGRIEIYNKHQLFAKLRDIANTAAHYKNNHLPSKNNSEDYPQPTNQEISDWLFEIENKCHKALESFETPNREE